MPGTAVDAARGLADALEVALGAMPQGCRADAERALRRLQDVVLPRLAAADAPILVVVGGPTGSGKSTVVNSLLGHNVTRAGAVRPTTRRPVLACSPEARAWFMSDRIFPRLAKHAEEDGQSLDAVTIAVENFLWPGVGVLDAPDIDSVEEGNRRLAGELLDGADLWVFVTSAARYADAVAWNHLEEATRRGLRIAIVLNRVPLSARSVIRADMEALARRRGLGDVPIMTIDEQPLADGLLPIEAVAPVGAFLESIGRDAGERARIVRRSLSGAVSSSLDESTRSLDGARESIRTFNAALEDIDQIVAACARNVASSSSDDVLRGEVSTRIADVLGSWDMTRATSRFMAKLRSRVRGAVRGRGGGPETQIRRDLIGGVAQHLADQYHRAWREAFRRAEPLVASVLPDPLLDPNEAAQRSRRTAQEWTSEVTNIVRGQAESSRLTGRLLAGGINVVTVSLMVSVFAMTGGITGIEVGVAGASAALSQTILESYFGERTVRSLAQQARESLERLANSSVRDVVAPVVACLDRSDDTARVDSLDAALKRASEVLV